MLTPQTLLNRFSMKHRVVCGFFYIRVCKKKKTNNIVMRSTWYTSDITPFNGVREMQNDMINNYYKPSPSPSTKPKYERNMNRKKKKKKPTAVFCSRFISSFEIIFRFRFASSFFFGSAARRIRISNNGDKEPNWTNCGHNLDWILSDTTYQLLIS